MFLDGTKHYDVLELFFLFLFLFFFETHHLLHYARDVIREKTEVMLDNIS